MVESRVADRSSLIPFVELSQHYSVVHIRRSFETLKSCVVQVLLCTIRRQIGENDDDRFVVRVVALNRLSAQEQTLVVVHELDNVWHAPVGDLLRSEPKCLTFQGTRHEGTYGPSAAQILVRPGHESLDPVCDAAKRTQILVRELPRPARSSRDPGGGRDWCVCCWHRADHGRFA